MRMASFLPFQATYYLNGHSFIEQELNRSKVAFRKSDNAFLAIEDVAALQAAADRLSFSIPSADDANIFRFGCGYAALRTPA